MLLLPHTAVLISTMSHHYHLSHYHSRKVLYILLILPTLPSQVTSTSTHRILQSPQ
jgi:hypothetical protein